MDVFDKIYQRASASPKKIVLPEGNEPRVIKAAAYVTEKKLARIVLLGKEDDINKIARKNNLNIKGIEIINPQEDRQFDDYVKSYAQLRKHRGVTIEYARDLLLRDFVYYGAMMLRKERVNGFVAGAAHTTSDIARAAFQCIERKSDHFTASSSFLVEVKDSQFGEKGLFLFADCGIVPLPTVQQLVDIAVASVEIWRRLTEHKPRVAMLSFSTKGSSSAASVEKVREATQLLKKTNPDLLVDGELQVDSAIVPEVARIKVPESPLRGEANILIFPNLDAGNIAYKLMQRLGNARVVGPIIQGLGRPCSDLSRGARPQEIIDAIAAVAVLAQ